MASRREKCALWCRLESGTSTIGANGTALGTTTFATARWGNGALVNAGGEGVSFPATLDYVPPAGTLQIECIPLFTITDGVGTNTRAILITEGSGLGVYVYHNTSGFRWNMTPPSGITAALTPALMDAAFGSVNSLVLVWNTAGIEEGANIQEVYWNGVLVASSTNALSFPAVSSIWTLGNHQAAMASWYYNGTLDNIKIFHAALRDRATGAHRLYEGWLMDERKGGGHVIG